MQIAAILLARATAWIESTDLNPRGASFYPAVAEALVKRYNFNKFPQKEDEFDEGKGVLFQSGYFDNTTIEQFIVYRYGLVVDTRDSTDVSKKLLVNCLEWGRKELGLVYHDKMIKRWHYESQICFETEANMINLNPIFSKFCDTANKFLSETINENLVYEPVNIVFNFDNLRRKHVLGPFSLQRRDNTPFSDNRYFSSAPLPTDLHIKLLKEYEAELLATK